MISEQEIIDRLKSNKLFSDLQDGDIAGLAKKTVVKEFMPGEFVIKQNDTQHMAYLVHKGKISIHIDALLMSHFSEGSLFGEFSMLDGTKYTASAVAQEPSILIGISRDAFFDQIFQSRDMAIKIIEGLVKRLKRHIA